MRDLVQQVRSNARFQRLVEGLRQKGAAAADGLWGSSMALVAAALAEEARPGDACAGQVVLCVTAHVEDAEQFAEDVSLFAPDLVSYFPAPETADPDEPPDADLLSQRLLVLKQLLGRDTAKSAARLIVAPVAAVLLQVPSPSAIRADSLQVKVGQVIGPERIVNWLVDRRFTPAYQVEVPGEFSQRGGILDIFPYSAKAPFRIEFFGDDVESIRTFDILTQSSLDDVSACEVTALGASHERPEDLTALIEYLPADSWILLREPAEVMQQASHGPLADEGLAEQGRKALTNACERLPVASLYSMPAGPTPNLVSFEVHSVARFGRELPQAIAGLKEICDETARTVVLCNNEAQQHRLGELLAGADLPPAPGFETRIGRLSQGFQFRDLGVALVPHHEIFHRYQQRRPKARYRHTRAIDTFLDLEAGDYVAHAVHGIGQYRGLELMEHEGEQREFLRIQYEGGAELFVPSSKIELVQKYVGGADHAPPLSRLGGKTWARKKERARNAAEDLAADLLALQARRAAEHGIAHPRDDDMLREFEAAFIYEETEDQLAVNEEIKRDMESSVPMDRLVCGDVGYGKTELAMRAAFKTVMGGRQAAVLVPTTVLAAQHYRNFRERMADYPIFVEMLSRFRTRTEQRRIVEGLADGHVDIVIGTHRLVQPDVVFRDLGLVIIDEEQRFGVEHKERLKHLRETVDVLTLTATPIPRTLQMSLLGMRDISSLNTPPQDRLAIHTRLWRFDEHKIRQAILREMARDGQVFFLHNRVQSIESMAHFVGETAPEARLLVAHGQMSERLLESRMRAFVDHKADVLVCTTIIESGLDIPNVNTIIINRADMFGLAELHQLRGRVGRYKHRAYAYLMLPEDRPVTPDAEKRLKAIEEFAHLGAGFKIAMRDLEIRGAGNILGREQHGHIVAVGYDMYCRLLEMAVRKLRDEPMPPQLEVSLSLGLRAYLPETYVPEPRQRMEIYRRLQRITCEQDVDDLEAELRDRFGPPSREAVNLLNEAKLRLLVQDAGIASLVQVGRTLIIESDRMNDVLQALEPVRAQCRRVDEKTLHLPLDDHVRTPERVAGFLAGCLRQSASALKAPAAV